MHVDIPIPGESFSESLGRKLPIAGALILAMLVLIGARDAYVYVTWPRAEGVVTEARIENERPERRTAPLFHPQIRFRYTFAGRTRERVAQVRVHGADRREAEAFLAAYPIGTHHAVLVDPADPDAIELPTPFTKVPIFVASGSGLLVVGLVFRAFGRKRG